MSNFGEIDTTTTEFGELYDELPLWSAPFGVMMLERVPMKRGMTIVDVGAGTGFLTVELAQRCGSDSRVIAVDPSEACLKRWRQNSTRARQQPGTSLSAFPSRASNPSRADYDPNKGDVGCGGG